MASCMDCTPWKSSDSWARICERLMTMCGRPGSIPGRLSKLLRPMIIGLPMVVVLKCLRSAGRCQMSVLFLPMTLFSAMATIADKVGFILLMTFVIPFLSFPCKRESLWCGERSSFLRGRQGRVLWIKKVTFQFL